MRNFWLGFLTCAALLAAFIGLNAFRGTWSMHWLTWNETQVFEAIHANQGAMVVVIGQRDDLPQELTGFSTSSYEGYFKTTIYRDQERAAAMKKKVKDVLEW